MVGRVDMLKLRYFFVSQRCSFFKAAKLLNDGKHETAAGKSIGYMHEISEICKKYGLTTVQSLLSKRSRNQLRVIIRRLLKVGILIETYRKQ